MMAKYRYMLYLHLVFYLFLRGDFFDGNILSELHDSWILGAHVAK